MALFRFPWLRRFVRKTTNPIPVDTAGLWKKRLSVAYALIAWNAFGFVCLAIYHGKADLPKYLGLKSEDELKMTPAQQWTKTLGIKDASVYKVSGLNVTHYEIHNDFDEDEKKKLAKAK